jgi:hypothetical protein
MDSKTQLLYTANELFATGYRPGSITAISFNVAGSFSNQVMDGFQVRMKNTSSQSLTGTWESGLDLSFNGSYAISGSGWQTVTLQTPFSWNGSSLLIQICFDNNNYSLSSQVFSTQINNMAQHYFDDNSQGCSLPLSNLMNLRPNLNLTFANQASNCGQLVVNHFAGTVAPVNKTVTYSTVTNIAGETSKCWITKNLGASQQATAVNDATEASAGWYWQFNRKQGYKHDGTTRTPGTPWITSISENSNWQTASDPCTLELGSSWRIPTSTEWVNVNNANGWTSWTGPWGSGLKLHAAGILNPNNGILENRGTEGGYWCNIQYSQSTAEALFFFNTNCNVFGSVKINGCNVRCLRD